MSYLKEKYKILSYVKLSTPQLLERANSIRLGWGCFYKIAFKVGLRFPLHRIINMVLNFFNIAPGQLMLNGWQYLLGLVGRYVLHARRQIRLLEDAPTSDKNWKDRYFFVKREGLFDSVGMSESGVRSAWTVRAKDNSSIEGSPVQPKQIEEEGLLNQQSKSILTAADMDKLKMKMSSKAQLEELQKKEKKAAQKSGKSPSTDDVAEAHGNTVVVQQKDFLVAIPVGDFPSLKKCKSSSPLTPSRTKGKEKHAPLILELEDSSTIRAYTTLVSPIMDALMTRHDCSILRGMTIEEVGLDAEQSGSGCSVPLRFLLVRANNAYKKKAKAYNNVVATNNALEEDNLNFKQSIIKTTNRKQLEKRLSEANLKLIDQDHELEVLRQD
ncbi:hypothetical protein FNV43_RR10009 [Rhamnella rubrinervis]|uniref:Uncharacterized protein n=1 Tax=Rhamnella rubrinervis TaxID=2594499 RepID=A0A8K0HAZ5_9ROSA|nr:hypothetical protein FNV43_RR10009 [Rhamnella rubrinervis]